MGKLYLILVVTLSFRVIDRYIINNYGARSKNTAKTIFNNMNKNRSYNGGVFVLFFKTFKLNRSLKILLKHYII